MKTVQYFTKEYLELCKGLSSAEILEFMENFRLLHTRNTKSKLISMKVPEALLESFKFQARLQRVPYQRQIKILMEEWLQNRNSPLESPKPKVQGPKSGLR